MLGNYERSAYDWQFRLLGIPVRVTGWFWLVSVILGWNSIHQGVDFLAGWVAACFVSILVHELGHALIARRFGYPVSIALYQFGGVAQYQPFGLHSAWRSIAISLAGPVAGFGLYGVVLLLESTVIRPAQMGLDPRTSLLLGSVTADLKWINLWWGLLNLLPILPLDGGRISQEICQLISARRGMTWALWISVVVGGLAAWLSYQRLGPYSALLFGLLAAESLSTLQRRRSPW